MTQEERKKFDAFQRQLNESPVNRINFLPGWMKSVRLQTPPMNNGLCSRNMRTKPFANIWALNIERKILRYRQKGLQSNGRADYPTWNSKIEMLVYVYCPDKANISCQPYLNGTFTDCRIKQLNNNE